MTAAGQVATIGADGCFKHLNPAWETTLGWPIDQLVDRPFSELIPVDIQKLDSSGAVTARCSSR
jgi:PAS domain-containing protein